jgi:hypothetical protein
MADAPRTIHRFTDLIGLLNRGHFVEKCDEHLQKTIAHLESLPDRKGTATITITLTCDFMDGQTNVTPAVKSKLPEEKGGFNATPFWSHDGGFSTQHPSQFDMFPRTAASREREAG